jgi:hypothetical protein
MQCLAAAPTGIAAANIEIDGTDICAATLHSVFDLDGKYESKLDFTKPGADKVAAILKMKAVAFVCVSSYRVACGHFRLGSAWRVRAKRTGAVPRRGAVAPSAPPQMYVHLVSDVWLVERVAEGGRQADTHLGVHDGRRHFPGNHRRHVHR